ncbi:thioesterase family protein [Parvibaculaceae bacterium PLY_AMNH_Bact1]|nr:thioesterase family protein [Parvibaculaceae bacterium PLY_AMNH_Bact1]
MNAPSNSAVFTPENGKWHPAPQSMGPFGGMHGGAVSGLLTGELEILASKAGHGPAISAAVYLLRPAPATLVETRPTAVREGGRVAVYENELWANDKLQAKASICFLKGVPDGSEITGISEAIQGSVPDTALLDPADVPKWQFPREPMAESFLNAVDIREDEEGTIWIRATRPLFDEATLFASTISFADFSTLFSVVATGGRPNAGGWPNADLSMHLSRLPVGPWIGIKTRSDWFSDGRGMTESEIHDVYGRIGRSTQAVVLAPAPKS